MILLDGTIDEEQNFAEVVSLNDLEVEEGAEVDCMNNFNVEVGSLPGMLFSSVDTSTVLGNFEI